MSEHDNKLNCEDNFFSLLSLFSVSNPTLTLSPMAKIRLTPYGTEWRKNRNWIKISFSGLAANCT